MLNFTGLTEKEVAELRRSAAENRLKQLEAEYIQITEAVEQCMMGDCTDPHTAEQLKMLQLNKETVESVHKKYAVRAAELAATADSFKPMPASPVEGITPDKEKAAQPVAAPDGTQK